MSIFNDIARDVLNRNNIDLEHVASGALGEAVIELDDILRNGGRSTNRQPSGILTAEQINNGNYDGSANNVNSSVYYAQDYDRYAPKSKFLFKVWFQFNEAYEGLLPTLEGQGSFRGFSYVIKTIDKPKVNYEYEEVNMYNHRTKVLKTIRHEPISMSLHDDISNSVMDFFNLYRTAFSPVSRLTGSQSINVENDGMSFGSPVQSANSRKVDKEL